MGGTEYAPAQAIYSMHLLVLMNCILWHPIKILCRPPEGLSSRRSFRSADIAVILDPPEHMYPAVRAHLLEIPARILAVLWISCTKLRRDYLCWRRWEAWIQHPYRFTSLYLFQVLISLQIDVVVCKLKILLALATLLSDDQAGDIIWDDRKYLSRSD